MDSLGQSISLHCCVMEMRPSSNRCNINASLIKTPMKVPTECAVQRNTQRNIWILTQDPEDTQILGRQLTSADYIEFTHPSFLQQAEFIVTGALKGSVHSNMGEITWRLLKHGQKFYLRLKEIKCR